jgi:hypothetical protein
MSPNSKIFLRWAAVLMIAAVLLAGLAGRAQAVQIINNDNIPAGQTIDDDALIGGNNVSMDGTVNGTLMAFGSTVQINGNVKSDVIAAGQNVIVGDKAVIEGNLFVGGANLTVRGKVNGSIFGGGYSLSMAEASNVGRNIYFGGYDFEAKTGSVAGRDINVGGYQAVLSGTSRNVNAGASAIEINGTINGDANLRVSPAGSAEPNPFRYIPDGGVTPPESIQPGLRISQGAKISGKLTYTSESNQSGTIQAAPGGGIVYQTPVPDQRNNRPAQPVIAFPSFVDTGFWLWGLMRNLVTILILGALAWGLVPTLFQTTLAQLQQRTLASIGVGLLALIVVLFAIPVIVIALLLIGLFFGILTLVDLTGIILGVGFGIFGLAVTIFFIAFGWAGKLLLAYVTGTWILNRLAPQSTGHRFWSLALGALIFALIAAIPIFGFLFTFVVDLAGVGALWYVWRNRRTA